MTTIIISQALFNGRRGSAVYPRNFHRSSTVCQPLLLNRSPKFFKIFCKQVQIIFHWARSTYFCSLIPNHPTWRRVKMLPWEVMGKKLFWSRDQPVKRTFRSQWLGLGLGLGWRSELGLGWWPMLGLGLWFGNNRYVCPQYVWNKFHVKNLGERFSKSPC